MSILDFIHPPRKWAFAEPAGAEDTTVTPANTILTVDVTVQEAIDRRADVTRHPVERGVDVVDHKRRRPIALRMSGVISDSPNDLLDVLNGNITGLIGSEIDPSLNGNQRRSQEGYDTLVALYERVDPITVVTQREVFANMIISQLHVHKNDSGYYLGFDLELDALDFATTDIAGVEVASTVKPTHVKKSKQLIRPADRSGSLSFIKKVAGAFGPVEVAE